MRLLWGILTAVHIVHCMVVQGQLAPCFSIGNTIEDCGVISDLGPFNDVSAMETVLLLKMVLLAMSTSIQVLLDEDNAIICTSHQGIHKFDCSKGDGGGGAQLANLYVVLANSTNIGGGGMDVRGVQSLTNVSIVLDNVEVFSNRFSPSTVNDQMWHFRGRQIYECGFHNAVFSVQSGWSDGNHSPCDYLEFKFP